MYRKYQRRYIAKTKAIFPIDLTWDTLTCWQDCIETHVLEHNASDFFGNKENYPTW